MKNMTKCKYADKYKAKREPTCGCDYCLLFWKVTQLENDIYRRIGQLEEERKQRK